MSAVFSGSPLDTMELSPLPPLPPLATREAVPSDNAALLEIAAACPMEGDLSLCIDRAPDFFALDRLEGEQWRVGVVDREPGMPIGCVAAAARTSYVHGVATGTTYVGDLKVVPGCRGHRAADALTIFARDACQELAGRDAPTLLTILDGNRAMERRTAGPRGLPVLQRFATIRSHAIPLLRRTAPRRVGGLTVERAGSDEIEEMVALWSRVAPTRQFSPVFDAERLAGWIDAAPGLERSSYWLARDGAGRLVGFLATWDQRVFKQLRVVRYSPRLVAVRVGFNGMAAVIGATPLPPAGAPLRVATVVHPCIPADRPEVLHALLRRACEVHARLGHSFLLIGLDRRDPLRRALRGLLAQPTDIGAYITSPAGRYSGRPLDDRPLHHEIALV